MAEHSRSKGEGNVNPRRAVRGSDGFRLDLQDNSRGKVAWQRQILREIGLE
jgi:hypothetical protein